MRRRTAAFPRIEPDRDYPVRDTARLLGVVYDVVLRYIRDGKLPATKINTVGLRREWRVKGRDIEEFTRRVRLSSKT